MDRLAYKLFSLATASKWVGPKEKILISLSGGADSVALSLLLSAWKPKLNLQLCLIHFNHQLRAESDAEEAFCQEFAQTQGLEFRCFRPLTALPKTGLQVAARKWRQQVLLEEAQKQGAHKIALAHHRDDLSETLLWKMLRGTSLFGLSPMRACEGLWFRPLLGEPKDVLVRYLEERGQRWVEDSSNQEHRYLRNRIRHQLTPLMNQLAGTDISVKLSELSEQADLLRQAFEQSVPAAFWERSHLPFAQIQTQPTLFALELIHRFLLHQGVRDLNHHQLKEAHRLVQLNQGGWQVCLTEGKTLVGQQGLLSLL